MYILRCSDESYYTGCTKDLNRRLFQHQNGEGSNHTKKYGPVELIYYDRIDYAFNRKTNSRMGQEEKRGINSW